MRKNETDLIKSTAKRQLTAKGYRFLNRCISALEKNTGLNRYSKEIKPKKEKLSLLIHSLIIDKKMTIKQIKDAYENSRGITQ